MPTFVSFFVWLHVTEFHCYFIVHLFSHCFNDNVTNSKGASETPGIPSLCLCFSMKQSGSAAVNSSSSERQVIIHLISSLLSETSISLPKNFVPPSVID